MAEERMSAKQYAKFEKTFMVYGSTAKMVARMITPIKPDEWQTIAEQIWAWSIRKAEELVTVCSSGFLEAPPEVEAPAAEPPLHNGTVVGSQLNQKYITVKAVNVLKSGETNGRKWTRSKVVDTDNIGYITFAGHRYEVGKQYAIEWDEKPNGQYVDRTIREPK